jgi:hypothetical protein
MVDPAESRGRKGGAPRRRQAPGPDEGRTVKASMRLSAAAHERLVIHAAKARTSQAAVVERLIMEHLRRWVVSDRGGPDRGRAEGEGAPPAPGAAA